jgi:hypothetical protein
MSDPNFWKNNYKEFWGIAASKEEKVRKLIEHEGNCTCSFAGLGAGKTGYLAGSAKSQGFEKGGSDLHANDTDIYIEVTGPNIDSVKADADLWVRPDKIAYAIAHPKNDHWVVHALMREFYLRTIHLGDEFKEDYKKGKFKIVHPWIRGVEETYISIPAKSEHVQDIQVLFKAIRDTLKE